MGRRIKIKTGRLDFNAELGYWPTGKAFCIFFGPTPASLGDEIKAASAVNILGKITDDLAALWDVPDGAEITIESSEPTRSS